MFKKVGPAESIQITYIIASYINNGIWTVIRSNLTLRFLPKVYLQ